MFRSGLKLTIIITVLTGMFVFSLAGCGDESPSSVVEDFVRASADNDCDAVIDMLYFGEEMDSEMKDSLAESCKESGLNPDDTELISVETSEEKIDGDKATVMARTTVNLGGEEMSEEQEVSLIKIDGEWKIDISAMLVPPPAPEVSVPETAAPGTPEPAMPAE